MVTKQNIMELSPRPRNRTMPAAHKPSSRFRTYWVACYNNPISVWEGKNIVSYLQKLMSQISGIWQTHLTNLDKLKATISQDLYLVWVKYFKIGIRGNEHCQHSTENSTLCEWGLPSQWHHTVRVQDPPWGLSLCSEKPISCQRKRVNIIRSRGKICVGVD